MRARFAIVGSLVVMFVLAMLMSPAAGQTAISPEVTPEATIEAMPPGFEWVMRAPGTCSLSQDEALAAVVGSGLYDLSTGEQLIEFEPRPEEHRVYTAYFSEDMRQVIVASDGVYDIESRQKMTDFPEDSVLWGWDANVFTVKAFEDNKHVETLYDLETWTPVFPSFTYIQPEWMNDGRASPDEYMHTFSGLSVYGDIVMTYDLKLHTANVYDFATQKLLYTREFDGWAQVDPTNTYISVAGEDVRTLRGNETVLDDLPSFTVMAENRATFSTDGAHILVERSGVNYLYALPDGTQVASLPDRLPLGKFVVTDNGQSLLVTQEFYDEQNRLRSNSYELDIVSGEVTDGERIDFYAQYLNWPDSRHIIKADGIYSSETGELVVALDPAVHYGVLFSADETLAAIYNAGVYDLVAKRKLYDLPDSATAFSPDSRFIWVQRLGVLDARTGEVLYAMPGKGYYRFSSNSKYLMTSGYQSCNILALPEAEE
jgi:hypothetical protein